MILSFGSFLFLTVSVIDLQGSEQHKSNDDTSQEDEGFMGMSPLLQAHHAMERMEEFVCKVRFKCFGYFFLSFPLYIYLVLLKRKLLEWWCFDLWFALGKFVVG